VSSFYSDKKNDKHTPIEIKSKFNYYRGRQYGGGKYEVYPYEYKDIQHRSRQGVILAGSTYSGTKITKHWLGNEEARELAHAILFTIGDDPIAGTPEGKITAKHYTYLSFNFDVLADLYSLIEGKESLRAKMIAALDKELNAALPTPKAQINDNTGNSGEEPHL
jgi:hypothetical protein